MRQRAASATLIAPLIVLAACSGGDDAGTAEGSVDEWCSLAAQIAEIEADDPGLLAVDSAESDSLTRYRSLLGDAAAVAPENLLADANAMADGIDRFVSVAESVDYDFDRLDDDALVDVAGGVLELDGPISRIRAFNASECGLDEMAATPSTVASSPPPTTVPPTTDPAPTTAAPPTTESQVEFTGDPDSDWCRQARDLQAASDGFDDIFFAEPDEIEAFMADTLARVEQASSVAPTELTDEVAAWVAGIRALDEAFAEAGYDLFRADLTVIEERDAEMSAAIAVIDRYNADVCGIEVEPSDDLDLDFDAGAGTIRDQAIAEFVAQGFTEVEAACIFDNLDFSDPAVATDTAAIAEVLTICEIDFERLMELG